MLYKAALPYLECFKCKHSESLRLVDLKAAYICNFNGTIIVIIVAVAVATEQPDCYVFLRAANNDKTGQNASLFCNSLLN